MDDITLPSFAKVNLTLEVSAKRPDGYHDIDSVAALVGIADELRVSIADDGLLEVCADAPGVPSGRNNLVYRAAEAFFAATGVRSGAAFTLKKRIPVQAGLGGGSADAAAAIAALNALYRCGLAADELANIAASVGSDVAMFLCGGTVRMRGRGELVTPLPDMPLLDMVVVKPDAGVSTAWAYGELDRQVKPRRAGAGDAAEHAIREADRAALVGSLWNDFDPVVTDVLPDVGEAKTLLVEHGAQGVLLAGSGSAVFGVFEAPDSASAAAEAIRVRFPNVWATRTLRREECSSLPDVYE